MKIDSHNHFWKYDELNHAWIDDSMQILKRDFLPLEFEDVLTSNGIHGTIAVQADQSIEETGFLLDLASESSIIKGVVGWVDLKGKNLNSDLENLSQNQKLVGFRHIVQSEADDEFMLSQEFQNGLALLSQYDFTYDILIYPHQLRSAIKTVEKQPEVRFVLDHLAKPYIAKNELSPWQEEIKVLSGFENVMCKVSGLVTEATWRDWKKSDFDAYLDVVFSSFGSDRIMFGSDWPVCLLSAEYEQVLEIIEDFTDGLSSYEKEKVFGLNAVDFYGI